MSNINILSKILNVLNNAINKRGVIYITLGNFFSSVIAGLFWFILARLIIVESYGYVNYLLSLAALAGACSILGLNITIMTYIPKGEDLTQEADWIVFIISLIFCVLFILLNLFYVAILTVASSAFTMFFFETLGRKQYKKWMFLTISYRSGQLVSSLVLYFFLGLIGILIGYLLPPLLLGSPFYANLIKSQLDFGKIRPKMSFSLHAFGVRLSSTLVNFFDKILIAWIFGLTTLGLYHLGYQFFWIASVIPVSLFRYLLPEKASGSFNRDVELIGILATIISAIIAVIFSPIVIRVFFSQFVEAIALTQIMCLAVIPAAIVNIQTADLFGKENSSIVLKSNLTALIVEIAGLILLGKYFATLGLAIAVVISQVTLATSLWFFKHATKSG